MLWSSPQPKLLLSRKVPFLKQKTIANSPSKHYTGPAVGRALKYVLPTIAEKVNGNTSVASHSKKKFVPANAHTGNNPENMPLNKKQQQQVQLFTPRDEPYYENAPRSISNVRSQGSLFACSSMLRTPDSMCRNPPPPPAANNCPTPREKHMKKLKLLIAEANEKFQVRNRSLSIESAGGCGRHNNSGSGASPENPITPLYPTLESARPTDGNSTNDRTSEESRPKPVMVPPLDKKSARRSLISPPAMEPPQLQNTGPAQLPKKMVRQHQPTINGATLKKNFSLAAAAEIVESTAHKKSLVLPDDANYQNLVRFTENLRQVFVVPSTTRASNLRLQTTVTTTTAVLKESPSKSSPTDSCKALLQSTPQNHHNLAACEAVESSGSRKLCTASTNCQTLAGTELLQKFKEKPTNFAKYIKLKPKFTNKDPSSLVESSLSPASKEEFCFSDRSGTERDNAVFASVAAAIKLAPPSRGIDQTKVKTPAAGLANKGPVPKNFRIVRKVVSKPEMDNVTPKSPLRETCEIKDFPGMEDMEKSPEISELDCSEIRGKFHVQKGETVSLFPALKMRNETTNVLKLAVNDVALAGPFGIDILYY